VNKFVMTKGVVGGILSAALFAGCTNGGGPSLSPTPTAQPAAGSGTQSDEAGSGSTKPATEESPSKPSGAGSGSR